MYDRSGEPVVHSTEPGLHRTDVSGSEFEVGMPTSEDEVEREERAPKSPPTTVLESWLLSIVHCRFLVVSVARFPSVCRWCRNDSGSFRKRRCIYRRGDCWAVEGASHSCYQEPGTVGWGLKHDVPEAVQSRGQSRELLERAFDDGNICFQKKKLLILFHVDSKFLPHFCLSDQFVTDPAASVNRATGQQLVSLCGSVCKEEKAQLRLVSIFRLNEVQEFSVLVNNISFLLTKLNELLDRLKQGPSQNPQRVDTSESSGYETDTSKGRQKVLSKKTFRMKKVYAAT